MADAKPEPDLLRFLKDRYLLLKHHAETDNTPKNDKIAAVIVRIDELYNTINTGEVTHEKIVEQLKALRTPYNTLDLDLTSYTRYTEANSRLNMIVDRLEEVEAEEEEEEEEVV